MAPPGMSMTLTLPSKRSQWNGANCRKRFQLIRRDTCHTWITFFLSLFLSPNDENFLFYFYFWNQVSLIPWTCVLNVGRERESKREKPLKNVQKRGKSISSWIFLFLFKNDDNSFSGGISRTGTPVKLNKKQSLKLFVMPHQIRGTIT